jgi:hypothetical protein
MWESNPQKRSLMRGLPVQALSISLATDYLADAGAMNES